MGFNYGYEKKKFDSRWKRLHSFQNGPEKCRQQRKEQKRDRKRHQTADKQHGQQRGNSNHKKGALRDSPCGLEREMNELPCKYKDADYKQCDHIKSFLFIKYCLSFGRMRFQNEAAMS